MKFKRLSSRIERLYEYKISKIERGTLIKFHIFYKNYLRLISGFNFSSLIPTNIKWMNTTLKKRQQVEESINIIEKSKLIPHPNVPEKNWDSLIALNIILQNTRTSAKILDAGGQINSIILTWLYLLGYSNLKCINLSFENRINRGKIEFIPGDLTRTPYPDNYFDVITCLSVIEHGVNEEQYFEEMYRILKNGGLLITSTDYWETKIETQNKFAYGKPVYIYDKNSIQNLLNMANNYGFKLFFTQMDYNCQDKVVAWKRFNLHFTYIIFCLQKK